MTAEQEYINGCYTRYGTRPLKKNEIKNATSLSNGMFAVAGFCKQDGYSVDIYKDSKMKKLIYMQHNVHVGGCDNWSSKSEILFMLAEQLCLEMEI